MFFGFVYLHNKWFQSKFEHLKQNADLNNLHILGTISVDATPMDQIKAVLDKVVDTYDNLCTTQIWNHTTKAGPSASNLVVQPVDNF